MKGSHRIIIQNKRIRYDFIIRRNITVIRGDSATGKTALIDMVREHFENGDASAVELVCDKNCAVLDGRTWFGQLSEIKDSIVFIDEGNAFVTSTDFALTIQNTDNYYVIVSREGIPSLPYSVEEIYGIRNSGKYGTLKRTYNELYHLYPMQKPDYEMHPTLIITEDSNSGHQFFKALCEKNNPIPCISANGKSNIFSSASKQSQENILIIADGAAFGPEMDKMMELAKSFPNIMLFLPESFEWMILQSSLIEDKETERVLQHPENYIESSNYFSWERYFTAYLIDCTTNTYLKYNKRTLNSAYTQEKSINKILNVMEGIIL